MRFGALPSPIVPIIAGLQVVKLALGDGGHHHHNGIARPTEGE